ncbi:MAG TPA: c-type cytochrome [Burkholderiales bacterium]|nr:c-type cytochrome [Burkholderiales bacterium]
MRSMLLAAAALVALPQAALGDDVAARSMAATCAACHGTAGHSVTKSVEPLAGRPKERIVELMQAFKTGKKPATIMQQISKGYTDQQIEMIAGYLAAQKK